MGARPTEVPFRGVVALDGPSGTGKSTVARQLAQRLGVAYLDTGAMYRAATVAVLRAEVDLTDAVAVANTVAGIDLLIGTDPARSTVTLNSESVDAEIRSAETTAAVSAVAAIGAVREQLVAQQRAIISAGSIVAEGRDIGSVVWPDAELKVYLTATEQIRALRRAGELALSDVAAVAADIRRRDDFDSSRAVSPLHRPDGATEVDTSELSVTEVVDVLEQLARQVMSVPSRG